MEVFLLTPVFFVTSTSPAVSNFSRVFWFFFSSRVVEVAFAAKLAKLAMSPEDDDDDDDDVDEGSKLSIDWSLVTWGDIWSGSLLDKTIAGQTCDVNSK